MTYTKWERHFPASQTLSSSFLPYFLFLKLIPEPKHTLVALQNVTNETDRKYLLYPIHFRVKDTESRKVVNYFRSQC